MFATQYCVTPTKRANQPMGRMQERACTFLRDVKRRSLRVKRSKSLVINPKSEKRKSGKTQTEKLYQKKVRLIVRTTMLLVFKSQKLTS